MTATSRGVLGPCVSAGGMMVGNTMKRSHDISALMRIIEVHLGSLLIPVHVIN